jgi:hypothetical protein
VRAVNNEGVTREVLELTKTADGGGREFDMLVVRS